jgi:hypothetical protein
MAEDKPEKPEAAEVQNPFTPPEPSPDVKTERELTDEEAADVSGGTVRRVAELRRIVEMGPPSTRGGTL